jgi:sigma-54 dependent transcriptional regulator, acetoin dehydrogenase operon transcriptional activator AcoR
MREKTRPEARPLAEAGAPPHLCATLVLCGERPLLGGMAFDLAGVREVVFGRGGPLGASAIGEGTARIDVPDATMSGEHARLTIAEDGSAAIDDLGSRNGTRVNGQASKRARLSEGDWFVVGRSAFLLRRLSAVVPAEPFRVSQHSQLCTFVPSLAQTFQTAADLAPSRVPILLAGETGAGKEVVAREIHQLSRRPGKFVAVNCAALPETLVESELFGYRKGAFSDAREDRAGLIRTADKGTLLLDEIGDLPLGGQAKLLRALQDGQVVALGSAAPVQVDLRVLAATQQSLDQLVRAGRFRADLLGRLGGFTITVPPLRGRIEDLGLLVAALLERHAGADAGAFKLTADACCALLARRWPLNVRELERVLQAAIELCRTGKEIGVEHLGAELRLTPGGEAPADLEAELRRLLRLRSGNVSAVAREMGKARMQIHRWMAQFGIRSDEFRTAPENDAADGGGHEDES